MTVFLCVDDNGGLLFNHRRQSRDSAVIVDVHQAHGGTLYIHDNATTLFKQTDIAYTISANVLEDAGSGDSCFVEDKSLLGYVNRISTIVIYRWNRVYPADFYLDINLANSTFHLLSSEQMTGSSHKMITKEVWKNEIIS